MRDLRNVVLQPQQFETEVGVRRRCLADGEARMRFGFQNEDGKSPFGQNGRQHGAAQAASKNITSYWGISDIYETFAID